MFNPLHLFETKHLDAFIKKGVVAFVKQRYQRGKKLPDPNAASTFVLIHFEKILAAQQYFDVLKGDPERELLFINKADDLERIKNILNSGSAFMMLKVKDAEFKARKLLDKKIKAYIEYRLNWFPARQDEVSFTLDVQFGEVYARLKFRSREVKVKLEDIETCKSGVGSR